VADKVNAYVPGVDCKCGGLLCSGSNAGTLGKEGLLLDLIKLIDQCLER